MRGNITGTTTGEIWSFTTEAVNTAHDELVANEFSLGEAYPNPFNSTVRINLSIPTESQATVSIFDQTGRLVNTLLDNTRVNGNVELEWNATGHSAGVYFLRCECAGVSLARKLVYLP
ncbi:MAG: T9SS type A sorting domain-containing protein [bacterium]|nr:T9SS type A sorting domain-containing protein [bacterium]